MSVNMGQAVGYLDLDTTKFKAGFKSALSDLKNFQSETATSKDKLAAFSSAATSAGRSLTKGLTVPIAGVGAAAVAVTARFESSMSEVQAISGATGDDLKKLGDKAKEMGAKTKFSASESAQAFKYMALAGWETEDMLNGIEGVMNLAAASGEDLASVSDIVTDSLTAFGLTAKDSTHFADVLAKTMASSNTDVAGLGEAFKYVAPVAGAFGYSVEDVSVALGTMANAGIKGSSMGTALRQALVQLTSPSEKAATYMDKFGISLYDSQGNTKDLMTVMKDLRGTFSMTQVDVEKATAAAEKGDAAWAEYANSLNLPANEQEKLTALTEMFGARAMPAMLSIIQASDEDFNKLSNNIANADGAAQEMAETMLDNLPGAITIAKSAMEGLGIRIGEVMTPSLTKIIKKFTDFVGGLTEASDGTVKFVVVLGTVLAAIGPILLIVGTLTRNILTLIEAYDKLSKVMAGKSVIAFVKSTAAKIADTVATHANTAANLANKASLSGVTSAVTSATSKVLAFAAAHKVATAAALGVVGAVIGLVVYMAKTGTSLEDLKTKIIDTFNNIVAKVPEILNTVSTVAVGIIQQIPGLITSALSSLSSAMSTGFEALKSSLPSIADWLANDMPKLIAVGSDMVVNMIDGIGQTLPQMIQTGADVVTQFIDAFFAQVPQLIEMGSEMVLEMINGIVAALPQLVTSVVNFLATNVGPILTAILGVILKVGQAIITNLPTILSAITQILLALVQAIANSAPQIIGAALKLMLALIKGLIQALPQIIVAVAKIAMAIVKALLSIIGALVSAGVQILQALWQGISSWVGSLVGKVKGVGKKAFNGIKSGLGNLLSVGRTWLSSLWNGIKSWVGKVTSGVSSFARSLPGKIKSGLGSLFSVGANFIQGLWNGVKSKISNFISDLRNKLSEAAGLAKKIFKLGSPSRLMFQYGVWFMEGLENGIDKAAKPLMKSLNKHMNDIVAVYNPMTDYDFGVGESIDKRMLDALGNLSVGIESGGGMGSNIITQNITVDGAENPSEFAEQLARQLKISMRTL